MILNWTTSKVVISRIFRNIKGVEADYKDEITEWIAEAVVKMKTKYSLELKCKPLMIQFHQAKINFPGDTLCCITHRGGLLNYYPGQALNGNRTGARDKDFIRLLFQSRVPIYSTTGDPIQSLDDYEGGNPFPRDIIEGLNGVVPLHDAWYRLNYTTLQTSFECGPVEVYYMGLPLDEDNFLMIPDVEEFHEAVYWYVRMKLIEAGFEDKVFNHTMAQAEWWKHSGMAISQITYPTPSQVEEQVARHLNLFPHEYHWGAHVDWDWGGRALE